MSALRELFALFTTQVDTRPLDKADARFSQFKSNLRSIGEAVASAFALREITSFVRETIEAGDALADTAKQLQVTTQELQFMSYAMKLNGGSTEDATNALKFLTKNLGEAAQGAGTAGETFSRLHVQIKNGDGSTRDATDVLTDLADAFQKTTDPAKNTADAMAIFGRGGLKMIPILKQGAAGVAQMRKEFQDLGGGMSDEFIKAADAAQDEIDKLGFSWMGLKSTIVLFFIPIIKDATIAMQKWMKGVADFIRETGGFKTAIQALGIAGFIALVWKLVAALRALGVAEVIAEFAGFAGPIILIGILYLALDELMKLMTGGKTIIGEWLDEFAGLGSKDEVVKNLTNLWNEFMAVFTGDPGAGAISVLEFMGNAVMTLVIETANLLQLLLAVVTAVLDIGKAIGQLTGAGMAKVAAALGFNPDANNQAADALKAGGLKSLGGAGRALSSAYDTGHKIEDAVENKWMNRHPIGNGQYITNDQQWQQYKGMRENLGYVPGSDAIEFPANRQGTTVRDKPIEVRQPIAITIINPNGSAREVADAARSGTRQGVNEANRATLAAVETGG